MIAFLKKYYWILISACIVLLDQVTKSIISATLSLYEEVPVIEDFFAITHIHNEGIAFGMLSKFGNISKIIVAILTSVLIVVGVALETVKTLEAHMTMRHHKGFLDM